MIDIKLFNAGFDEDFDLLTKLIKEGRDINSVDEISNESLLFRMISFNCEKTATFLVKIGADINNVNNGGKTVLMEAVARGMSTNFIKLLISKGVDTSKVDDFGGNVLWWAENKSTIKYLKSLGLKLKKKISYIHSDNESFYDYFTYKKQFTFF